MRGSVSPRWFVGIVSAVFLIAGFLAFNTDVSSPYGDSDCGSVLSPRNTPWDPNCANAIGDRLVWALPLFICGLIGVAGAYLIRTARDGDRRAWETDGPALPRPSSVSSFQIGDCVEVIAGLRLGDCGTIVPAPFKLKEGYVCVELASDGTRQYIHESRLAPLDEAGPDELTG